MKLLKALWFAAIFLVLPKRLWPDYRYRNDDVYHECRGGWWKKEGDEDWERVESSGNGLLDSILEPGPSLAESISDFKEWSFVRVSFFSAGLCVGHWMWS